MFFLMWLFFTITQSVGTPVPSDFKYTNPVYTAYFNQSLKQPVLVVYKLYRGGGACSRVSMNFTGDQRTARTADYNASGYDIGHLANAEDFAYDCDKEAATFKYYNALPQTPRLNRGAWKVDETYIRTRSQSDSLVVFCGGIFGNGHKIIGKGVHVPTYCYKVVVSLKTRSIIMTRLYSNTSRAVGYNVTLKTLEKRLGYELPLAPYLNSLNANVKGTLLRPY